MPRMLLELMHVTDEAASPGDIIRWGDLGVFDMRNSLLEFGRENLVLTRFYTLMNDAIEVVLFLLMDIDLISDMTTMNNSGTTRNSVHGHSSRSRFQYMDMADSGMFHWNPFNESDTGREALFPEMAKLYSNYTNNYHVQFGTNSSNTNNNNYVWTGEGVTIQGVLQRLRKMTYKSARFMRASKDGNACHDPAQVTRMHDAIMDPECVFQQRAMTQMLVLSQRIGIVVHDAILAPLRFDSMIMSAPNTASLLFIYHHLPQMITHKAIGDCMNFDTKYGKAIANPFVYASHMARVSLAGRSMEFMKEKFDRSSIMRSSIRYIAQWDSTLRFNIEMLDVHMPRAAARLAMYVLCANNIHGGGMGEHMGPYADITLQICSNVGIDDRECRSAFEQYSRKNIVSNATNKNNK